MKTMTTRICINKQKSAKHKFEENSKTVVTVIIHFSFCPLHHLSWLTTSWLFTLTQLLVRVSLKPSHSNITSSMLWLYHSHHCHITSLHDFDNQFIKHKNYFKTELS